MFGMGRAFGLGQQRGERRRAEPSFRRRRARLIGRRARWTEKTPASAGDRRAIRRKPRPGFRRRAARHALSGAIGRCDSGRIARPDCWARRDVCVCARASVSRTRAARDRVAPDLGQFGIDEPHVEFGVVDDQPVLADEGQKIRRRSARRPACRPETRSNGRGCDRRRQARRARD